MDNRNSKLAKLIRKLFFEKSQIQRGNRLRHLTRIIAKEYQDNPEKLRDYFSLTNVDVFVQGLATSVYHFLTGDIKPIQEKHHGGLGAIISSSEKNLEFNKCQLWCAKISGDALRYSTHKDGALVGAHISDNGLFCSQIPNETLKSLIDLRTPTLKTQSPKITKGLFDTFIKGDIVYLQDEPGGIHYLESYGERLRN